MSDTSAEAGWYPDPHNANQQRYYDGSEWTDHYAPIGGAAPAEAWDSPREGAAAGMTTGAGFSDIGTLMGSAWTALTKRLGSLIGLTIGVGVLVAILFVIIVAIAASSSSGGAGVLAFIVIGLLVAAVYGAYMLIVNRIFLGEHQGVSLSIGQAWNQIKGRVVPFVGTLIGLYIVIAIAFGILAMILSLIHPVLLILLLPALIFVGIKLAFLPSAAAADVGDASNNMVKGSMQVSDGRFWPVLGRVICLALIVIAWTIIMQVITFAVSDSLVLTGIVSIISMIGSLLASLFIAAGTTKMYLESGGRTNIGSYQS